MTTDPVTSVEQACVTIIDDGQPVTFAEVAARVGLSKTTLYRRVELRTIIEEHRARHRDAHTLSALVVELDQLRQGLEAVATKVRHHEELLRRLQRRGNKTK